MERVMNKLALNFIFKNEEHVIERMLDSNLHLADLVVCVDTGSTDHTVQLIENWAKKNKIQVFIFYKAFDCFDSCRNFALHKLREVIRSLGWSSKETYGYWLDCDEVATHKNFKKEELSHDAYLSKVYLNGDVFSRLTFLKLETPFFWYGPVHEYLKCEKAFTSEISENFKIHVYNDGNSWQSNLTEKYLSHANILETHLQKEDVKDRPRWLFYLAQSYYSAALYAHDQEERMDKLNNALQIYKERMAYTNEGYSEEVFYSQYIIAHISHLLNKNPDIVLEEYKKASSIDPQRAEPLYKIISHHFDNENFDLAYQYSKKSLKLYHCKNPFPSKLLFIESELYNWKLLYMHVRICIKTNLIDQAKKQLGKLNKLTQKNPEFFNGHDIDNIKEINRFLAYF